MPHIILAIFILISSQLSCKKPTKKESSGVKSAYSNPVSFKDANEVASKSTVMIGHEYNRGVYLWCSGVIVATDAILTAAHCSSSWKSEFIVFGENIYDFRNKRLMRKVEERVSYPTFTKTKNVQEDVGILFFKGGLPEGYKVAKFIPANQLPLSGTRIDSSRVNSVIDFYTAGFGLTENGTRTGTLRKVPTLLWSEEATGLSAQSIAAAIDLAEKYPTTEFPINNRRDLIAKFRNRFGKGSSQGVRGGDSGGPWYYSQAGSNGDVMCIFGVTSGKSSGNMVSQNANNGAFLRSKIVEKFLTSNRISMGPESSCTLTKEWSGISR